MPVMAELQQVPEMGPAAPDGPEDTDSAPPLGAGAAAPPQQQDAAQATRQQRRQETLRWRFQCWVMSFNCLLSAGLLAKYMISMWLLYMFIAYKGEECDVPLQSWCYMLGAVLLFSTLTMPFRSDLVRFFCHWEPGPEPSARPPLRVQLFNVPFCLLTLDLVGLVFFGLSGSVPSSKPSCRDVAPGLHAAVAVFSALNMALFIAALINTAGLSRLMAAMARSGLNQTRQAAPKGTLKKSTTAVKAGDPLLTEQPNCSICLEAFAGRSDVVKTNACQHVFHERCLQEWFDVGSDCPLCRTELGDLGSV